MLEDVKEGLSTGRTVPFSSFFHRSLLHSVLFFFFGFFLSYLFVAPANPTDAFCYGGCWLETGCLAF